MPNQYVIYWEPSNLDNLGGEMKRASSAHFKKMSVGDTVYFVTKNGEGFVLLGKIVAGTITDSREKVAECLGFKVEELNFYDDPDWHIVANLKKAFKMKALPADELLEQIMVKSGGKIQKIKTPLSHQSFRSPRLLTTGSVRWLDEYLETEELPENVVRARRVQENRETETREREQRKAEEEAASKGWFANLREAIQSLLQSPGPRRPRVPRPPDEGNPSRRRRR